MGTVCKILDQEDVKLHKVRYCLERRDPEFAEIMAEVLCVYRAVSKRKPMAILSYDEKPGIQAVATRAIVSAIRGPAGGSSPSLGLRTWHLFSGCPLAAAGMSAVGGLKSYA